MSNQFENFNNLSGYEKAFQAKRLILEFIRSLALNDHEFELYDNLDLLQEYLNHNRQLKPSAKYTLNLYLTFPIEKFEFYTLQLRKLIELCGSDEVKLPDFKRDVGKINESVNSVIYYFDSNKQKYFAKAQIEVSFYP